MTHGHEHDVHRGGDEPDMGIRFALTIALNLAITAAQVVGGVASGSLALVSDAVHNFSDAVAVLVSYLAHRLSERESSESRTYGYRRAEVLAAMLNASALVVIAFFLVREALVRLARPHGVDGLLMLAVAAVGLAGNLAGVGLLRRGAAESLNVRAAVLHLVTDAASSAAVVVGALAIIAWRVAWVDPALTVLITAYVLKEAVELLVATTNILMQAAPRGIDLREVQRAIEAIEGVANLHHVHLWQLTERDTHFEGHLDLCDDMRISEAGGVLRQAESILREEFGISHVTLQLEYRSCRDTALVKGRRAGGAPQEGSGSPVGSSDSS